MSKYSDGVATDNKGTSGILNKMVTFTMQLFFGIVAGGIIVILMIPLLIYIIICLMLGKEPSIKLMSLGKRFNKDK